MSFWLALQVNDSKLRFKIYQIGKDMGHCRQRLQRKRKEKKNSWFFCQIITSRRPKDPVRWPAYFFYTKYSFAIEGRRLACYMSVTSSSSCFDSISLVLTLIRRFADSRDSSLSMSSNTNRLCYAWSLSHTVARETNSCPTEAAANTPMPVAAPIYRIGFDSWQLKTALRNTKNGPPLV